MFSSAIEGCLEKAKDYTAGGARYNPSTVAMVGFATVVDSLAAIRYAVFEEKILSLDELCTILKSDWKGNEVLRNKLSALPKFGHGDPHIDSLAAKFAADMAKIICEMSNERGGKYQASMFVYYFFHTMGKHVSATPDGRRSGDMLSQGTTPGRVNAPKSLTDVFQGIGRIDYLDYPANAVLDMQLPLDRKSKEPEMIRAILRSFGKAGGATIQINSVSLEDMKDAQKHPEKHQGLTIRIAGLSARFVCLGKELQDEIISRACY